jgi:hypothetical protein
MSAYLLVGPGMKLVARAVFMRTDPLFVSVLGPAAITFSSLWSPGSQEIRNTSGDTWQLSVHASRQGPIGSEVPVWVIEQSAAAAVIGIGQSASPEALLICAIEPHNR